jgi:hypothetical protein
VDGLYSNRACVYDDVHCMEAELGAVKGHELRAKFERRILVPCVLAVSGRAVIRAHTDKDRRRLLVETLKPGSN